MATYKLSPKYQVVIPAEIRKKLKLRAGQEIAVIEKDGIIRIIPIKPLREMKGFLKGKGITTEDLREETDRM
ncbi:MAG: AbrB/MazE/SpoVT family DNA-binding domain-containing protein [Nitrososphaerales archaeon]